MIQQCQVKMMVGMRERVLIEWAMKNLGYRSTSEGLRGMMERHILNKLEGMPKPSLAIEDINASFDKDEKVWLCFTCKKELFDSINSVSGFFRQRYILDVMRKSFGYNLVDGEVVGKYEV